MRIGFTVDMHSSKNRKYTKDAISRAVHNFHNAGYTNRYGEIATGNTSDIDMDRISHKVIFIDYDTESGNIVGKIEVLPEYYHGRSLRDMINHKISFVIIPRIVGRYNDDGIIDDCEILTFDVCLVDRSAVKGEIHILEHDKYY